MSCSNRKGSTPVIIAALLLIVVGCSRGPIGADARLGQPSSLTETRRALATSEAVFSPACLRNTTGHSIQFEMKTDASDWQRWILPPGRILQFGDHSTAEIRFVSVPVVAKSSVPGNAGALVHYQLDLDPPLREILPSRSCLHAFRPRPNGMLDLFLNSEFLS